MTVDELRFFLVDLGLAKKVAVVSETQSEVCEWACTKALHPKISAMSDAQRKKWRGVTIYMDEVAKGSRQRSR